MNKEIYRVTLLDEDKKLGFIYKTEVDTAFLGVTACAVIDTMKRSKHFRERMEKELGTAYGAIFPKLD